MKIAERNVSEMHDEKWNMCLRTFVVVIYYLMINFDVALWAVYCMYLHQVYFMFCLGTE